MRTTDDPVREHDRLHSLPHDELEDGIGGLAQSLFGFTLPYPTYVPGWKIIVVTVALFFVFATVYGGLMSWNERVRGLATVLRRFR